MKSAKNGLPLLKPGRRMVITFELSSCFEAARDRPYIRQHPSPVMSKMTFTALCNDTQVTSSNLVSLLRTSLISTNDEKKAKQTFGQLFTLHFNHE